MGRTLTATLTDAIAHPGPARAGSHLPSAPRPPATLATLPSAPAHFPPSAPAPLLPAGLGVPRRPHLPGD